MLNISLTFIVRHSQTRIISSVEFLSKIKTNASKVRCETSAPVIASMQQKERKTKLKIPLLFGLTQQQQNQ